VRTEYRNQKLKMDELKRLGGGFLFHMCVCVCVYMSFCINYMTYYILIT